MKSMKAVMKYYNLILRKTSNEKPIAVKSIKVQNGEQESFKHALEDLIISGMIMYTELNPVLKIKRIA